MTLPLNHLGKNRRVLRSSKNNFAFLRDSVQWEMGHHLCSSAARTQEPAQPAAKSPKAQDTVTFCCVHSLESHSLCSSSTGGKGHQGLESRSREEFPGRHAETDSLAKPRQTPLTPQQHQQPVILTPRTFLCIRKCFCRWYQNT